jgi:hypothetical protein
VEFIREQTLRMERAANQQERTLNRQGDALEKFMERVLARLDDMGDQIRANTQAVLRLLDRFDQNGGTAPAT